MTRLELILALPPILFSSDHPRRRSGSAGTASDSLWFCSDPSQDPYDPGCQSRRNLNDRRTRPQCENPILRLAVFLP
eukprot:1550441-Rhodomonas_salina.2